MNHKKIIFNAILCSGFIFEILLENHYSLFTDLLSKFEQAREVISLTVQEKAKL